MHNYNSSDLRSQQARTGRSRPGRIRRKTAKGSGPRQKPKLTPSQLIKRQLNGDSLDDYEHKPKITQFFNVGDFSIHMESAVSIDEPLFEPIPPMIQFSDYEPLQIKTKVFKLRNKDKVARHVRIIQPESRLFQVLPYNSEDGDKRQNKSDSKVAPGLEVTFTIKFSPEAKIDYKYELEIITEREKFVVPVIAVGKRAMIDFPDMISFGRDCPVKYKTEKPVIIRNLGDKTTKWDLELPKGFQADKSEGVLEYGKSEQIILSFFPTENTVYQDEAILRYDGLESFIPITGNAKNGDVMLSQSVVTMDSSYIGLETQKTVEIINRSNVKIDFQWRSFADEKEERQRKKKVLESLDQEEREKCILLKQNATLESNQDMLEIQDDDDSEYEEVDEKTLMLKKQRKAEMLLHRTYNNYRKAIEENLLLFQSDIFTISPLYGSIWPNSQMTVTISFKPKRASNTEPAEMYCNISCSEKRLKLTVRGEGLGPTAVLSTNNINIGDIYVNEAKRVPLSIENKGEIPARFRLIKNSSPFSQMINFDIDDSELKVTERKNFHMTFKSSKVGEFQEIFTWELEESNDKLQLIVRGHVRAPSFEFNRSEINFGTVSYQFDKVEYITLENTSSVSFKFNLRIPADSKNNEKEFEIKPESYEIAPKEVKEISIKFTPRNKDDYFMVMALDIVGVGKDMKSIPLMAKSDVPVVRLEKTELDFGQVYLREPKRQTLMLINESSLDARFQVIPQIADSTSVAEITTDSTEGIIEKLKNIPLEVTLTAQKIIDISLELFIKIHDNTKNLKTVKIIAKTEGPEIRLPGSEINFGEVQVLQDKRMEYKVYNPSTIKADFVVFTKNENSVFKPIQRNYTLQSGKEMAIQIVCNPDDTINFYDTLFFVITEGRDKEIKLRAKGVGQTLFSKHPLDVINFSKVYTYREQTQEIFIENKGRRVQTVKWERNKDKEEASEEKDPRRAGKPAQELAPKRHTFEIFPKERKLPPKTGIMFQFRAASEKKGAVREEFTLFSRKGDERKDEVVTTTTVMGHFINPDITFDKSHIEFKYTWEKGVDMKIMSEPFVIRSNSECPTTLSFEIEKPFYIYYQSNQLMPNKEIQARIDFDPSHNHSRRSGVEKRDLCIRHYKHPHKDKLTVTAKFAFPNLQLETHEINFGSVLNDTSKKIYMKMTNISEMDVEYEWSFLEEAAPRMVNGEEISTNEIFDILPLNGVLEKGQSEQVEFVYYGMPDQKFSAKAICQVVGGPDEKVSLVGESSRIKYRLSIAASKNYIDFEPAVFSCWTQKEFCIENLGQVPFDFKIKMDNIVRKGLIRISRMEGKIAGNNKTKIVIHFCPALPGDYIESFKIQVAHFEAETITVRGYALYPALKFELPRLQTEEVRKHVDEDALSVYREKGGLYTAEEGPIAPDDESLGERLPARYPSNDTVSELDRKILFNSIMKNIEQRENQMTSMDSSIDHLRETKENVSGTHPTLRSTGNFHKPHQRFERRLLEKVTVGEYTLDLGNVIAGKSVSSQIRIFNVGKMTTDLSFRQNTIETKGLRLDQTVTKLSTAKDKNCLNLNIHYKTSEKTTPKRYRFEIPAEINHGPRYLLIIKVNVTVPALVTSSSTIDFGNVVVGRRKIMSLRFSNEKEVDCKWHIASKEELLEVRDKAEKPAEGRFTMLPREGLLPKKKKQNLTLTFVPNSPKPFIYTFFIHMKENQKQIRIVCTGNGVVPELQFSPKDSLQFRQCLPYDDDVFRTVQVTNKSDMAVELFSLDFDQQFQLEDKMLEVYQPQSGQDVLYMDVKHAGMPFWLKLQNYYKIWEHNQAVDLKIQGIEDQIIADALKAEEIEQKKALAAAAQVEEDSKPREKSAERKRKEKKNAKKGKKQEDDEDELLTETQKRQLREKQTSLLLEKQDYPEEVNYPTRIEDALKRFIVVTGPKNCGKTKLIRSLARKHLRGVVNMNEVVEWNTANKTEAAQKVMDLIDSKADDMEKYIAEKEKERKKKKKKDEEGPINVDHFYWLPQELLEELLAERLKDIDCNTGAYFDNLYSKYFENELVALQTIFSVCQHSEVQLVQLKVPTDPSGLQYSKLIDAHYLAVKKGLLKESRPQTTARREVAAEGQESAPQGRGQSGRGRRGRASGQRQRPRAVRRGRNTQNSSRAARSRRNQSSLHAEEEANLSDEIGEPEVPQFLDFEVDPIPVYDGDYLTEMKVQEGEGFELFMNRLPEVKIHKFAELQRIEEESKIKKKGKASKNASKQQSKLHSKNQSANMSFDEGSIQKSAGGEEKDIVIEFPPSRFFNDLELIQNHEEMVYRLSEVVPDVNYPDPTTLKLSDPVIQQIVKKNFKRKERQPVTNIEIFTPQIYLKDSYIDDRIINEFKEKRQEVAEQIEELKLQKTEELALLEEQEAVRLQEEQEKREQDLADKLAKLKEKFDSEQVDQEEYDRLEAKIHEEYAQASEKSKQGSSQNASQIQQQQQQQQQQILVEDGDQQQENQETLADRQNQLQEQEGQAGDANNSVDSQDPQIEEAGDENLTPQLTSAKLESLISQIKQLQEDLEEQVAQRIQELQEASEIEIVKEELSKAQTRWVIPSGKTIYIVAKFFSNRVTDYKTTLSFEHTFLFNKPIPYQLSAVCKFPAISQLPEGVFSSHPKRKRPSKYPECLISKKYVSSEEVFDFGPLLIGKTFDSVPEETLQAVNSTVYRISNNSEYKIEVSFDLASNVITLPHYQPHIYSFRPDVMELEEGECKEVRVFCLPEEPLKYVDELICMVKGNPKPYVVSMQCQGARPELSLSVSEIEFERILLNKTSSKTLKVINQGLLPAKWEVRGLEELNQCYTLSQTEGVLKPSKEAKIQVSFSSDAQEVYESALQLFVTDVEELNVDQEPQELALKAEAFDIEVDFEGFQEGEQVLEFGDVEVGRKVQKTFSILNNGLYEVKYSFNAKKKVFRENFTIEPTEGNIPSGESQLVKVTFLTDRELSLSSNSSKPDIVLDILEGKSQESHNQVFINVSVNAVYSAYTVSPGRSINFGPLQFNEQSQRSFEIRNDGLFEFKYSIFDYGDEEKRKELADAQREVNEDMLKLPEDEKDAKKKAKAADKKPKGGKKGQDLLALAVGQFVLTPAFGSIPPQSSVQVSVTFTAEHSQLYERKVAIDVQNRDPEDQPKGVGYELVGESCIPLINNSNFDAVFEEQIVVQSLHATGRNIQDVVNSNVYCIEEKCFYFGNLIPSKYPQGVTEKFKIINVGKVHAQMQFEVTKLAASANDEFEFSITPSTAKIPPHESVYVKVTFSPKIMARYAGLFLATVVNTDPSQRNNGLQFALKGQGVLPTLKLDQPRDWQEGSRPLMQFSRLRQGKRHVESIVIKNDGVIPATVEFDIVGSPHFQFLTQTSYTLSPNSSHSFQVEFRPQEIGKYEWPITFSTALNPYEKTVLTVSGECYFEGIAFEGLPQEKDDEACFGDNVVNVPRRITFFVKNYTDSQKRFEWDLKEMNGVAVRPRSGHINAFGTKAVHLVLQSEEPIDLKKNKIACITKDITQASERFLEWDDSRKRRKFVTPTEHAWMEECTRVEKELTEQEAEILKRGKRVPKRKDNYLPEMPEVPEGERRTVEIQEMIPEPEFDNKGSESGENFDLMVSGTVDSARYECDISTIDFKPTMMYTSRVYTFKVQNTSKISMPFRWQIVLRDGTEDDGFYDIIPRKGKIPAESTEVFTVKFAPLEVETSNLRLFQCLMPNLLEKETPLEISVDADAERPVCHFELPLSNYLESRSGDIPNVDNSKLKIIEFESLGVKVRNKKRFYVINPTATSYEFSWKRLDLEPAGKAGPNPPQDLSSFFRCGIDRGVILSGKKFEMVFEYRPEIPGSQEGLWLFEIPKFGLKQHFLTVGRVLEPKVFFEVGKVDFGPLLLKGKNRETIKLKNLDHLPYHFSFQKSSIRGDSSYGDSLQVTPLSGVIAGGSEIPLNVTFKPKIEGHYNYNLVCKVAQKPTPLTLNVKGIGYMLHHSVHVGDVHAPVLASNDIHNLDFGNNFVNEMRSKVITIRNDGDFNFDFIIKKTNFKYLTIYPETATVKTGSSLEVTLTFDPAKVYRLRPTLHQVTLSIISGPNYYFKLRGSARKPGVDLSFAKFDFGPCFVMKTPIPRTAVLRMFNRDNAAMTIEPLFEKKKYLDVQLPSGQVLLPREEREDGQEGPDGFLDVPIVFTPRELKKYEETVSFDINGLHVVDVRITGEGVPLKLDLVRAEDSFVDYGICRVGADVTRVISLANYSKGEVTISFDVEGQLQELAKSNIELFPEGEVTIKAKDKYDIELRFHPKQRINQFKKELFYRIVDNDETHQLLIIQGSCHGMELKLLEDSVNFGGVVLGSKLVKRIDLSNMGDIGAKFQWDTTFCERYFTITPTKGFLPANDSTKFEVAFHPDITDEISFNIKCLVENSHPLNLSLTGKGISQKNEDVTKVEFETMVRTTQKKKVSVKNPTGSKWRIKANITTVYDRLKGYFSGEEVLEVGPNSTADYEIEYHPLSMTRNDQAPEVAEKIHEAKLFFPLPDGSAQMFDLEGRSQPPGALDVITVDVKAKSEKVHTIPISNWLPEKQRFEVSWDFENENEESVLIRGANTIDLPAQGRRDYKLSLYGIKQGSSKCRMSMRNRTNGEFIFFDLTITVQAPDSFDVIELSSVVRETVSTVISVSNPLDRAVEFKKDQIVLSDDNLQVSPSSFLIQPKTEIGLELTYRPLVEEEKQASLKLTSQILGNFVYDLKLTGTASQTQKTLNFKANLGSDVVQTFKIFNFVKKQIAYSIKIEPLGQKTPAAATNSKKGGQNALVDFSSEGVTVTAPASDSREGVEVPINIKFEPSSLNESRALLKISSPEGGEYSCYLVGQTLTPQPKGPFHAGSKAAVIEFKNPFKESKEFKVRIDNPNFTSNAKTPLRIEGKKTLNIQVSYKSSNDFSNNGRLMLEADDHTIWTFYLQGD